MTPDEARARILAQATPAERAAIADFILNSNQELPLLLKDARSLWQRLEREAKNKESIPNTGN
jgi:dephospho-CoA kinase